MKRHERPYGCTFMTCNKTFGSKNDWKRHENSQHFHLETWRCDQERPDGGSCAKVCYRRQTFSDHLVKAHQISDSDTIKAKLDNCRIGRNCQARFWCGFCKVLVALKKGGVDAWTERFDHIDDHFMGRHGRPKQSIQDWVPVDSNQPKGEVGSPQSVGSSDEDQPKREIETPRSLSPDTEFRAQSTISLDEGHEQLAIGGCSSDINLAVASRSKVPEEVLNSDLQVIAGDAQSHNYTEWDYHKEEIHQILVVEGKNLKETIDIIQEKHGLQVSAKELIKKLKEWGVQMRTLQKGKGIVFFGDETPFTSDRLEHFKKRKADTNAVTISQDSGTEDYLPLATDANNASEMSPRSIIEQPSFGESTADDHDIQRDARSTVKAHADSAASEYEASERSADDASIFSLPDSLSSKSSLHDLLAPTEQFATMLIDDAKLTIQYQSLRQIFDFPLFKSELHHLLKLFSKDLSKEASIPIEKESVRFISQQR
ncbi:hypothetical protein N431DRAFT_19530 [Stipitochalara longipes BDJ]|nr:hypothetical protein N431DRAFT_19530 [Stipitochalara longipes BDJ]